MEYNFRITGQIIGVLRVQHQLSQEALSKKAGIARSHLAMIENGEKSASVETLWKIACGLDLRLSDLLRMVENSTMRASKS